MIITNYSLMAISFGIAIAILLFAVTCFWVSFECIRRFSTTNEEDDLEDFIVAYYVGSEQKVYIRWSEIVSIKKTDHYHRGKKFTVETSDGHEFTTEEVPDELANAIIPNYQL